MQTISLLLFRLQESGLGSQDILSEKPWKLEKNMLESFLHRGKMATYVFCINQLFQAIWSRKNFHKSFFNFFFKVKNRLKSGLTRIF